jgi:hypothetical protein
LPPPKIIRRFSFSHKVALILITFEIDRGEKLRGQLKFGGETGLLTDFIGGDAVKLPMSFDRYNLDPIGVNRVFAPFPDDSETVFFEISDKVTPADRHRVPQ